jgi:hypothetical protein
MAGTGVGPLLINPTVGGWFPVRNGDRRIQALHGWCQRRMWLAQFRDDISGFIPYDAVQRCIVSGRAELEPEQGVVYEALIDPASGIARGGDRIIGQCLLDNAGSDRGIEFAAFSLDHHNVVAVLTEILLPLIQTTNPIS